MKLSGKVALVTGVSPNIGGGIAEELAAEGARIVAVDADAGNARDCAAYLRGTGMDALEIVCDVTDETQVRAAMARALETFGRIDILVNNAATINQKGVLDMSIDEWRAQTSVILDGAFLFTKHAAQAMIAQSTGGVIINIISTAGHQGQPGNVAYSTGKMGLINFTNSTAMELAAHNIRVNSLTPTATDPAEGYERARRWGREVTENEELASLFAQFARHIPMQKLPRPSDYGKAAAFLASEDAAMITGVDLRVDAGAVSKYWAWDPAGNRP